MQNCHIENRKGFFFWENWLFAVETGLETYDNIEEVTMKWSVFHPKKKKKIENSFGFQCATTGNKITFMKINDHKIQCENCVRNKEKSFILCHRILIIMLLHVTASIVRVAKKKKKFFYFVLLPHRFDRIVCAFNLGEKMKI